MNPFSLTLSPKTRNLGCAYLLAELFLLPPVIYGVGGLCGGISDAAANFIYYLLNALCCGWIFRDLLRQSRTQPRRIFRCAAAALAAALVSIYAVNAILGRLLPEFFNVNDASVAAMVSVHPLLMGLGTILLVPPAEECLFRGLLFVPFYRKNHALGYLVSVTAFAAIHVIGYIGVYPPRVLALCFLQYLPAGLALGWACGASGSLFAPMLVHSAVNAVSFFTLR